MRNRRPSPEHEQAVARRLALLAAEWDTAKAAGVRDAGVEDEAAVTAEEERIWNPPTRVTGSNVVAPQPVVEVIEAKDLDVATGPVEEELPPLVRAPGRHAARRGLRWASRADGLRAPEWFVAPVAGARARLSSAHLTWVAVLVALALGTTCWWLLETKESEVLTPVSATFAGAEPDGSPDGETPGPSAVQGTDSPGSGEAPAPGGPKAGGGVEEVVVDVAGKVRRPGIVVLPAGSRVVDALEAAGGAKQGVDLTSLNLARRLLDGEQVLVGRAAAAGPGAAPAPGAPSSATGVLVNLNSASQTELETLPGVGPVTAAAIVEWRERHGGFTAVEDLLEVDGIGDVTLKRLAPLVSV